jgi:hypothetical protein
MEVMDVTTWVAPAVAALAFAVAGFRSLSSP